MGICCSMYVLMTAPPERKSHVQEIQSKQNTNQLPSIKLGFAAHILLFLVAHRSAVRSVVIAKVAGKFGIYITNSRPSSSVDSSLHAGPISLAQLLPICLAR
jgi:hypothetical protein